jgi:hypothetical protein
MEFSIEGQSGAAGFAPKALLDRAWNGAFETPPKGGNIVEPASASSGRIPVPVFFVIGYHAERNLGRARRHDRSIENWRIVSAMHVAGQ